MKNPVILHCNYVEQGQSIRRMCELAVHWGFDGIEFRQKRSGVEEKSGDYLDAVEEAVAAANYTYMRIDGSTPAHKRQENVDNFQTDNNIRIAILSIMAAGTGVTLTRVSECVFGELYWVPGVMIQAEDRVHRISQEKRVSIQYLLGTETLDTYVHPALCKKLATLDTVVDQRTDRTFQGVTSTMVPAEEEESILKAISNIF